MPCLVSSGAESKEVAAALECAAVSGAVADSPAGSVARSARRQSGVRAAALQKRRVMETAFQVAPPEALPAALEDQRRKWR